ncbi:hypothetical protein E7Z59_08800 [Robertkochia marina]|uniref:Alpha-1,2-fucosyltransferase n=1 Tax=Robertkochia marina TaxID=1227945 RepID=A0A4S3M155_9FLAO|nr:alpha-1,2-fucosyltransferase [Robertkochia marina]THD67743.1 hypothetical protein E7Z59_08800 [Robertkochia marina]TRZ40956.1 hypothetical protein D3A96_14485 [Robertkochia marina]
MMSSKKIWLQGGYGNVLFQVLPALYLRRQGEEVDIVKTLTHSNFYTRSMGWKTHSVSYEPLLELLELNSKNTAGLTSLRLMEGMLSKKMKSRLLNSRFFEGACKEDDLLDPKVENYFGYFQDPGNIELFSRDFEVLREKVLESLEYPQKIKCIGVHFRWGDSGWVKGHPGYYEEVHRAISSADQRVVIVTDDMKMAKQYFRPKEGGHAEIISSEDPMDDFKLLLQATTLYTAPSTFSWWAGNLSKNAEQVYMPEGIYKKLGFYGDPSVLRVL